MLEAFRKGAQSWVAKVLLGILALSFGVLWGVSDFAGTVFLPQKLATVGSRTIDGQVFSNELQRTLQRQAQMTGQSVTMEEAKKLGLDRQVLEQMMSGLALEEEAKALGLHVGREQIAQEIANNKNYQNSKGEFDPDSFRSLLQQNGMSEQGYIAQQQTAQLRGAITSAIDMGAVPKVILDAQNQFANETRDAKFFTFKVSESDVPQPAEADINKQYADNPVAYTAPEYRSLAIMKVEPSDLVGKFTPNDDELNEGFTKYGAEFEEPEKRSVLQITFPNVEAAKAAKAKLDGGQDFMALATEMKLLEKDILFVDKTREEFLDAKIAEAAFATAEGKVSEPVQGSLSTALIKVTKVTPGKVPQLAEIKNKIAERVKLDRAREEIDAIYAAVEDARAAQTKFEDIANTAGIKFQLVPAISATGLDPDDKPVDLPGREEVMKAMLGSDVGVENDALIVHEGYVWYEVRSVIASAVRPLDKVKDRVTKDWKASKLRTLAEDKAKAVVERLKKGEALDKIATEQSSSVQTANGLKRIAPAPGFDGLAIVSLFAAPEKGFAWALEPDGLSARVMQVEKVTVPPLELAKAETKQLKDAIRSGLAQDMSTGLAEAARISVGATVNEDMWRQINGGTAQ